MAKAKQQAEMRDLENFEDIMGLTAEDIREPSLYPTGPWVIRNVGYGTSETTDKEGNEQLVINLRYEGFEPRAEVDPDEVARGGFEGKTLWVRRYISKPAKRASHDGTLARFVRFVQLHGVDTEGRSLDELCKAMKGAYVLADLGTRSYTNREGDSVTDNTATNFANPEQE